MKNYYFTFGYGQPNEGKYHIIAAENKSEARAEMFERFGRKWSMCYSEEQWTEEDGRTQSEIYNLARIK